MKMHKVGSMRQQCSWSKLAVSIATVAVLAMSSASLVCADGYKGRVLIVGVNNYTDPAIMKLNYSDPDAHLVANLLSDPSRGIFSSGNVRVLADDDPDPAHKPTRLNILEGVQWLSEASPDETVLLYFSGHGCVDGGKQYLASQDTALATLRFTAVAVDDINGLLDDTTKTKAKQVVVIFDSCHSGVRRGAKAMDSESGQVIAGLMNDADGRVTLSSCNAEEYSFEDPDKGHGVFTYYLAEGLNGAADANGDGLISVGELHVYVRKKVGEWAQTHGQTQTPRVQSNVSGDIILARDPVKYAAAMQAVSTRNADLVALRSGLLQRIAGTSSGLTPDDGGALLAALDSEIAGSESGSTLKLESLARRLCGGQLSAPSVAAEIRAAGRVAVAASTASPAQINVQLFQPTWQQGASPDDYTVQCAAGGSVKVVGLAKSPNGITQVLVDGDVVKSRSLGSREIVLVRADDTPMESLSQTDMRFEGTVTAGSAPSTVVVTVVDSAGSRRLIQLHLKPSMVSSASVGVPPGSGKPAIAIIGLGHTQVDDYQELRSKRIGQGFHNVLTNAARDTSKFTLVEEKTDVLRALVDRQTLQKSSAFDQGAAIQTGKLMGAKYVLYGEVYDFASPKENRGKLFMQVEVRLVNVETGQYVPGYGKAEAMVPKSERDSIDFDRSTLASVSDQAIRAALLDVFAKAQTQ